MQEELEEAEVLVVAQILTEVEVVAECSYQGQEPTVHPGAPSVVVCAFGLWPQSLRSYPAIV